MGPQRAQPLIAVEKEVEHANTIAAIEELSYDVRADIAGATGDEDGARGV